MYNFLKNLTLKDTGRLKTPKTKNPTGLTVRVMANGEVYPSEELVQRFDLEYKTKEETTGLGFDVVDSTQWSVLKDAPRMILFGVTPKKEPKVDLFASARYTEEGKPKSSVLTQGSVSKTLLTLVKDMGYLSPEQKYVDLQVVTEYPIKTTDGMYYIPKSIEKGANAGQETYVKRENIVLFPVNTVENLKQTQETETVTTSNGTTNTLTATTNQ